MSGRSALTHLLTRDNTLFAVGILGIIYETVVQGSEKPTLLILFGGMVGLPVFLRTDEKQHNAEIAAQEKQEKQEKQERAGEAEASEP